MLVLGLTAALAATPAITTSGSGDTIVQLQGDLYGARMDTPIRIRSAGSGGGHAGVLDANRRALTDLATWVDLSADAVNLDDYGRFRLVVAAVDAFPMRRTSGAQRAPRSLPDALRSGVWTDEERLLAIGGGLRAAGIAATAFQDGRGQLLLGISCDDRELNVDAVEHRWRTARAGVVQDVRVRWVLWDGRQAIGMVDYSGALKGLDTAPPTGRALRLIDARAPSFSLSRAVPRSVSLRGGQRSVRLVHHPDAAGWLGLAPERHLPAALPAARSHVRASGLLTEARRELAGIADEGARINALIRLVQGAFPYEPGPVRTVPELLERGKGDCDQLSLVLAALLLELGYAADDVVIVSWPDHLGLAIRPRGPMPKDAAHLTLRDGRFVLVDVTHYIWSSGRLVSRWGRTSPTHGTEVTVQRVRGG